MCRAGQGPRPARGREKRARRLRGGPPRLPLRFSALLPPSLGHALPLPHLRARRRPAASPPARRTGQPGDRGPPRGRGRARRDQAAGGGDGGQGQGEGRRCVFFIFSPLVRSGPWPIWERRGASPVRVRRPATRLGSLPARKPRPGQTRVSLHPSRPVSPHALPARAPDAPPNGHRPPLTTRAFGGGGGGGGGGTCALSCFCFGPLSCVLTASPLSPTHAHARRRGRV